MATLRELRRLADGLRLVVLESARSSGSGSLESSMKAVLTAATDVLGISSGRIHQIHDSPRSRSSVVHFSGSISTVDSSEYVSTVGSSSSSPETSISSESEVGSNSTSPETSISPKSGVGSHYTSPEASNTPESDVIVSDAPITQTRSRRRPRERRVPSTPLGRAIG